MIVHEYEYLGVKYKSTSKTQVCRDLGVDPTPKELAQVKKVSVYQAKYGPRKRVTLPDHSSPYKKLGIKRLNVFSRCQGFNLMELPTAKEVHRPLDLSL